VVAVAVTAAAPMSSLSLFFEASELGLLLVHPLEEEGLREEHQWH
jgi:hypothetical protein